MFHLARLQLVSLPEQTAPLGPLSSLLAFRDSRIIRLIAGNALNLFYKMNPVIMSAVGGHALAASRPAALVAVFQVGDLSYQDSVPFPVGAYNSYR